jgi:hypothetical protein
MFNDVLSGQDASAIQGAKIVFGQYGHDGGSIKVNDHVIDPKNIKFDPALKTYSFDGPAKHPDGGAVVDDVSGHFNFTTAAPTGILGVAHATFNVTLAPDPLKFNVKVSANAGASFSSGTNQLTWDTTKSQWKNAHWENTMEFWYDTKTVPDPVLGTLTYIENYFIDKSKNGSKIDLLGKC